MTAKDELRKYSAVMRMAIKARAAYPAELVTSTLFIAIVMYVFAMLWKAVASSDRGLPGGYSVSQIVWYFFAAEIIVLAMNRLHRLIETQVRTGEIAILLNKPLALIPFFFSQFAGEALLRMPALWFFGGVTAYLHVGSLSDAAWALLGFFPVYLLALFLNFLFAYWIGLISFWLDDISGAYFLFDRLKWVLGGFLLPLDLFPPWFAKVAVFTPFSLMIYEPAKVLIDFSFERAAEVFARQVVWAILLVMFTLWFQGRAVRQFKSHGG